ncbi:KDO2-lipid IV(A) lauroyltransferase [Pontibacter ummariensis]|uniref:KDO2-lipid IV(A) lauroyltransferase n=1 Tax=Pontibacter ummariensis TaxID=1610492 RepID=A0A239G6Y1_9BACT|nr:lysophospholipid acyltransferase family protein [Pontibacter ummariensis]PRY11626.1 KDO2-lipid IV(A) lauroyltransferase [Pontibacter ummariensis]SNS64452.1 KDO2-lipid IV(A) lauroyltransferase [Pontibacter ummariensis]
MNKDTKISPLYYPFWLLLNGLASLPLSVLYLLADFLYWLMYYVVDYRKKVVLQNLRMAFPEKSEEEIKRVAKAFYRQFADVMVEILRMAGMSREEMQQRVVFTNPQVLSDYVEAGTPVLILGSHAGNWEWSLSAAAVSFNFPAEGVYKPLSHPFFEAFMLHTRSHLGAHLIKMKDTLREFVAKRRLPRVVALLSDQTPLKSEITFWTEFLHQETPFYTGAEKLSRRFGYPVLFLDVKRTSRGHYALTFEDLSGDRPEPTAAEAYPLTEAFARKLEAALRRNPADYLWTHKRWKHKRPEAAA